MCVYGQQNIYIPSYNTVSGKTDMKYIKADRVHDENDDSNDNIVFCIKTVMIRYGCGLYYVHSYHYMIICPPEIADNIQALT